MTAKLWELFFELLSIPPVSNFVFGKVMIPALRRMIWATAVLVRRDDHTADTDEWLKKNLGIDPPGDESLAPSPPPRLDVIDPPDPDPQFVKDSGWFMRGKWPGEENL